MNLISASLIDSSGYNEAKQALIRSVSRHHGFFELRADKANFNVYMDAQSMIGTLMASRGGLIVISSEHKDFERLMSYAALVWNDGTQYELELFGRKAGFCVECRGELETAHDVYQTCLDCQARIISGDGIEPRPLAKAFVNRMNAWHERHGDFEAIEELKALM